MCLVEFVLDIWRYFHFVDYLSGRLFISFIWFIWILTVFMEIAFKLLRCCSLDGKLSGILVWRICQIKSDISTKHRIYTPRSGDFASVDQYTIIMAGSQGIKLFKYTQKIYYYIGVIGIDPTESNQMDHSAILTIARKWLFIFSLAQFAFTTTAYFLFEASSMIEYGLSFYSSLSMNTFSYFWRMKNFSNYVQNCERFIEKREYCSHLKANSETNSDIFILLKPKLWQERIQQWHIWLQPRKLNDPRSFLPKDCLYFLSLCTLYFHWYTPLSIFIGSIRDVTHFSYTFRLGLCLRLPLIKYEIESDRFSILSNGL